MTLDLSYNVPVTTISQTGSVSSFVLCYHLLTSTIS